MPTAPLQPLLECRHLVRSFGARTAVDGLTFEVASGEAYGLLGPNGAGKTTLIKMVCGILEPESGVVQIGGIDLVRRNRSAALATLGYVPQELALFADLSLEENVGFWARLQGIPRSRRRKRVQEVLDIVGLGERARDRLAQCSGGMQRRVNFAAALVHEPRLLVLDEPTVGVDAQSRAALLDMIGALRDSGVAVLYTSHYFDEVEQLCDRIGIIDHGQLLVEGTAAELLADQRSSRQSEGEKVGGRREAEDTSCHEGHRPPRDLQALFLSLTGSETRD